MKTTPNFALPFPEGTDQPAGHIQIKALAEALDEGAVWATASGTLTGIGTSWTWVPHTLDGHVGGFTINANGAIAVPKAGVYVAWACARLNVDGWDAAFMNLVGSPSRYGCVSTVPNSGNALTMTGLSVAAAGTQVGVQVRLSGTGTATQAGSAVSTCQLSVLRLGPAPAGFVVPIDSPPPDGPIPGEVMGDA